MLDLIKKLFASKKAPVPLSGEVPLPSFLQGAKVRPPVDLEKLGEELDGGRIDVRKPAKVVKRVEQSADEQRHALDLRVLPLADHALLVIVELGVEPRVLVLPDAHLAHEGVELIGLQPTQPHRRHLQRHDAFPGDVLQALLAYLLAACGEDKDAYIPAAQIVERFRIPEDQLQEHLSLLNLVNFGGGCYAVYAELHGDEVHVDKELFGDTFRRAPRLTPLEARAIRLALEFVGPMIAAEAETPLERVRQKLEDTFGEFDTVAAWRGALRERMSESRLNQARNSVVDRVTDELAKLIGRDLSSWKLKA